MLERKTVTNGEVGRNEESEKSFGVEYNIFLLAGPNLTLLSFGYIHT